jgi:sugar phosphate isomerase/epimerase
MVGISGTEFVKEPDGMTALLDAARAVGAESLEVWYPENFGPDAERALRDSGVRVACVASGSELGIPDPEPQVELLRAAITVAHRLGAPLANTYFGPPGQCDDVASIDRYAKAVAGCLDLAAELGVTVVLENEFDAFGHDPEHGDPTRRPESLRRLVDTVGHPHFGLNFDAANLACAGVTDLVGALEFLGDAIRYAHVKDVLPVSGPEETPEGWTSYRDGDRWYRTCPLGTGVVPWLDLLPRLAPRVTAATLEPHAQPALRRAAFAQALSAFRRLATGTALGVA